MIPSLLAVVIIIIILVSLLVQPLHFLWRPFVTLLLILIVLYVCSGWHLFQG